MSNNLNNWSTSRLDDINERLKRNQIYIDFEKDQILKAEQLLSHLKKSFAKQTLAIQGNGQSSQKGMSKILKPNQESMIDHFNNLYSYPQPRTVIPERTSKEIAPVYLNNFIPRSNSRPFNSESPFASVNAPNEFVPYRQRHEQVERMNILELFTPYKNDAEKSLKRKHNDNINFEVKVKNNDVLEQRNTPMSSKQTTTRLLAIPELKGKKIIKIILGNGCIVCGSSGLLLRYTNNATTVYKTEVLCDIVNIELMKTGNSLFIVAFGGVKIMIFDISRDIADKVIHLPGISPKRLLNLYNYKNRLCFPLNQKKSVTLTYDTDWEIFMERSQRCPGLFFLATLSSKYHLVNHMNMTLCVAWGKDLMDVQQIDEIKNVKNVIRYQKSKFICSSSDTCWFLNEDCEIVGKLDFKFGIKLVACDITKLAVVDNNNTVHVHFIVDGNGFGRRKYEHSMEGIISCLAVYDKVYVAVEHDLYVVNLPI